MSEATNTPRELWMVTATRFRICPGTFNALAEVEDYGVYTSPRKAADAIREGYSNTSEALGSWLESNDEIFLHRAHGVCLEILPIELDVELGGECL